MSNAGGGGHVVYTETGSTAFSLNSFQWRQIKLKAAPCPANKPPDHSRQPSHRAGGFSYKDSSSLSSLTRNRFIIWHYADGCLKLLELSLDMELAYNAVELVLESPDLLPEVSIHEVGIYDVMVLFGTSTTVYRLVLPHPVKIKRTSALSAAAGKGKVPSVLNFASEESFVGPNSAALFNQVTSVPVVTCCVACADIDRKATFALASPSGSIVIIQLQDLGLPVRMMLQETSVVTKLLSSFLPVMGKRSVGGVSEDAPVALLAHEFDEQPVVLAVCLDFNLRLWSVQLSQCVMTHDLSVYLLSKDEDSSVAPEVDQILLRAAPDSTPSMFRFAIHLRNGSLTQMSIFEVELVNNQLHMLLLHSCVCPEDAMLVDFSVSRTELLGMWQTKMKDSDTKKTSIMQVIYGDVPRPTGWRDVGMATLPDSQMLLLPHLEPREFYLDAIFHPGRFSTHAIYKALELYESAESSDYVPSLENLAKEVTLRVEQEVQSSAGSLQLDCEEYHQLSLKCWSKFYLCCVEYQELASKPVALVQDPRTGMGLVLKQNLLSFLRPAHPVECISSSVPHQGENSQLVGNMRKFISGIRQTLNKLTPDILESFIFELGCYGSADINPPIVLAGDLAQAIQTEGWDEDLYKQLSTLPDITSIIQTLLAALKPAQDDEEMGVAEDMDEEDGYTADDADLVKAIGNMFGGLVAMTTLSSAFLELCHYRLCLCRDILVALLMLRRRGGREMLSYVANTNYQTEFSRLIQRYYSLYWLASHNYTPPPQSLDPGLMNLQQLAALDISSSGDKSRQADSPCTLTSLSPLPLAYLSLCGCKDVVSRLVKRHGMFKEGSPALWSVCFPAVLDNFIKATWPVERASDVAEFLLDASQHCNLQTYVETVVGSHNLPCDYTLHFLLGKSLIQTGELEKAFACFNRASNGIMSHSNPFLRNLVDCQGVDGKMTKEEKKERKEVCLARYYERVMRLFEEVSAPRYVILVAQEATRLLRSNDAKCIVFWSIQFKYQLEFGDGKEAYEAMMSIPDHTLRVDCLRQLIIVLTEQNKIQELCEFKYTGLEREVEEVMEQRARSVDVVKYQYYNLLYCYHVTRSNRRKAAYVMYEHALRLEREFKGPESLHKQANCYSMTILLLRLVDSKYAWVVRPVQEAPSEQKSKRKRPRPGEKKDVQMVEVLTIADIDKTYSLVRAKLRLLQVLPREPSMETQLSSPFMSVEDVVSLMVQSGMFDDAVQLASKFSLPLTNIFEALASRCVHLSMSFVALADPSADNPDWEWLDLNKTLDNVKVKENSIADKAWYLLEASMDQLSRSDHLVVQRGVARKLLSMGHTLPQWLVDKYKTTNPAELLYLYLTFDLLELAASLAIEYIDAVMGHGKEYFGLETGLHAASPSVWLPHHLLSHLKLALSKAPQKTEFEKFSSRFTEKVEQYFELARTVSDTIEDSCQSLGGL